MNEIFSKNSLLNGIGSYKQQLNKSNKLNSTNSSKGGMINVKGIILCGNGPLKSQLYQSIFLKHYIKSAIISIVDINYGGKFGFYECIKKSSSILEQDEYEKENELIENIMTLIGDNNNIVSIGFNETIKALNLKAVKYIILSSGYYKYAIKLYNDNYNDNNEKKNNDNDDNHDHDNDKKVFKQVKFAKNDIELKEISQSMLNNNDGGNVSIEVVSFMKFFDELCFENGAELKSVGMHSPTTQQFAKGLSGCVGVLHYAMDLGEEYDDEDEWLSDD